MDYVKSIPDKYYSYRFVLLPETIGSIAYLSLRKDILKKNVFCDFNLTCFDDERAFYTCSRKSNIYSSINNFLSKMQDLFSMNNSFEIDLKENPRKEYLFGKISKNFQEFVKYFVYMRDQFYS